jgi:flavodoxin
MRNHESGEWWRATVEDDTILVEVGEGEETTSTTEIDAWEEFSMPAINALDELAFEMSSSGFEFAPIDNVLALIESGHGVTLSGRLRAFFETDEYRDYDALVFV